MKVRSKLVDVDFEFGRFEYKKDHLLVHSDPQQSIATTRGTSARTVANQIAIAYRKLGLGSRRELVEWVGRQSLRP